MDTAWLRSVALKAVYVVIAAAAAGLLGWLDAHPDVGLWTMDSLKIALLAAVVAGVKKWIAGMFLPPA